MDLPLLSFSSCCRLSGSFLRPELEVSGEDSPLSDWKLDRRLSESAMLDTVPPPEMSRWSAETEEIDGRRTGAAAACLLLDCAALGASVLEEVYRGGARAFSVWCLTEDELCWGELCADPMLFSLSDCATLPPSTEELGPARCAPVRTLPVQGLGMPALVLAYGPTASLAIFATALEAWMCG